MSEIDKIKNELLEDLWLPAIRIGGNKLYPRIRKNKKMKVFTLTTNTNFQEIISLVDENLTERENIIALNDSHLQKIRLETEVAPTIVFGPAKFEKNISSKKSALVNKFPFEILMLDFSSQKQSNEEGRVETEIMSIEKSLRLQTQQKQFILIYTTLVNSRKLNLEKIKNMSNRYQVEGWDGIRVNQDSQILEESTQKINIIEDILKQLFDKYKFDSTSRKVIVELSDEEKICSLAFILKQV